MKTFLSCVLTLLLNISIFAQSDFKFYDDVSVPQTDAYNFVQHGKISPSLYTGTMNFSIPLYTYQDNDFTIPIVLSYSSNGNKPNQRSGILGPGWNLELGGCITLETRGIPDYGRNMKNVPGFLALHDTTLLTSAQTDHWWRFMYQYDGAESGATCPQIVYTPDAYPTYLHSNEYDAEPDLFHFNFMGHVGTFHLDYNKEIVVFGTQGSPLDYEIKLYFRKHFNGARDYSRIDSICITTPDAYKYFFLGSYDNSLDLQREQNSLWYEIITSWHLSRVEAPNGRTILFQYVQHPQTSYSPGSAINNSNLKDTQYRPFTLEQFCYFPSEQEDPNKIIKSEHMNAFLSNITIGNEASIDLNYTLLSQGDQYRNNALSSGTLGTFNDTYRLGGISVSFITHNGTNKVSSSSFSYTGNSNGARTNYLTGVTIEGEGTYSLQYYGFNGSLPYPCNGTINIDHYGYYNGTGNISYYPQTSLNYQTMEETILSDNRTPNSTYAQLGMISRITYPTGGYSIIEYEPNDYSMVITRPFDHEASLSSVPKLERQSGTTAGLRVKAIKSYLCDSTLFLEQSYSYTDSYGSSGILTYIPRYSIYYSAQTGGEAGTVTEGATYKSSNILSYNSTHIEYRSVTEHIKDSSRVVYTFTNSASSVKYRDTLSLSGEIMEPFVTYGGTKSYWSMVNSLFTPHRVHTAVAPLTSYQSVRGMPVDKVIYGSLTSNKPLTWEHTEYNTSSYGTISKLPCYLVRKFALYGLFIGNYPVHSTTTKSYSQESGLNSTDSVSYIYNIYNEPVVIRQTLPSGDTLIREYVHLRDLPPDSLSLNTVYAAMIQKNLVRTTLSEKVYLKKGGVQTLIDGRVCKYGIFNNLVKPQRITRYYLGIGWKSEITFNSYDTFGNITQLTAEDGKPVSYRWGFGGQRLLAQAVGVPYSVLSSAQIGTDGNLSAAAKDFIKNNYTNAEITFIDYNPGYGVSLLNGADGTIINYTYTQWRKLQSTINALSNAKIEKMDYSNEYYQQ